MSSGWGFAWKVYGASIHAPRCGTVQLARLWLTLLSTKSKEKFLSAVSSDGFGFCSVILYVVFCTTDTVFTRSISGWDLHDTVYSRELLISNSANGYRDLIANVDLSTLRFVPWEKNVPFFLVSFLDPETKAPVSVCPRGLLKRIEGKAEQSGWQCFAGIEFEVCASDA